jgi:hypothetical protein
MMLAYFVHNEETDQDVVVLPDTACSTLVDRQNLENFIAAKPDFMSWAGDSCVDPRPEDFGKVIATRDDTGDICVVDEALWKARMTHYLGERP